MNNKLFIHSLHNTLQCTGHMGAGTNTYKSITTVMFPNKQPHM